MTCANGECASTADACPSIGTCCDVYASNYNHHGPLWDDRAGARKGKDSNGDPYTWDNMTQCDFDNPDNQNNPDYTCDYICIEGSGEDAKEFGCKYYTPGRAFDLFKQFQFEKAGQGEGMDNYPRIFARPPLEICSHKRQKSCKIHGSNGNDSYAAPIIQTTGGGHGTFWDFYMIHGKAMSVNGVSKKNGTGTYSCHSGGFDGAGGCHHQDKKCAWNSDEHVMPSQIHYAAKKGIYKATSGGGTWEYNLAVTMESIAYCPSYAEASFFQTFENLWPYVLHKYKDPDSKVKGFFHGMLNQHSACYHDEKVTLDEDNYGGGCTDCGSSPKCSVVGEEASCDSVNNNMTVLRNHMFENTSMVADVFGGYTTLDSFLGDAGGKFKQYLVCLANTDYGVGNLHQNEYSKDYTKYMVKLGLWSGDLSREEHGKHWCSTARYKYKHSEGAGSGIDYGSEDNPEGFPGNSFYECCSQWLAGSGDGNHGCSGANCSSFDYIVAFAQGGGKTRGNSGGSDYCTIKEDGT